MTVLRTLYDMLLGLFVELTSNRKFYQSSGFAAALLLVSSVLCWYGKIDGWQWLQANVISAGIIGHHIYINKQQKVDLAKAKNGNGATP